MKILAITLEKCSGCAVLIDDKIVFSTSEERYSRIKSDSSFPRNSINDALSFSGLKGADFDKIIICGNRLSLLAPLMNEYSTFSVNDQIRAMEEYWYPNLVLGKNKSFLEVFKDKINLEQFPFNTEIGKKFDIFKLHNPYTEEDGRNVSNFFKQTIASLLEIEQEKIKISKKEYPETRLFDDIKNITLVSASSIDKSLEGAKGNKIEQATAVGIEVDQDQIFVFPTK